MNRGYNPNFFKLDHEFDLGLYLNIYRNGLSDFMYVEWKLDKLD
mgnify:CR=1 FL=1